MDDKYSFLSYNIVDENNQITRKELSSMFDIITYLLYFIQVQNNIIFYLLVCLGAFKASKKPDEPVNKPYRKLKVDEMPIFDNIKKYDYNVLLKDYKLEKVRNLSLLSPSFLFLNLLRALAVVRLIYIYTITMVAEVSSCARFVILLLIVRIIFLNLLP